MFRRVPRNSRIDFLEKIIAIVLHLIYDVIDKLNTLNKFSYILIFSINNSLNKIFIFFHK